MDKLRAIHYFVAVVEGKTFAAAARRLEVSTPAVTQLVGALEHDLGFELFHRSTGRGLALTGDGERYYETAQRVTAELQDAEQRLGPRGAKPRGTLTVGMRPVVAERCVMPRIRRFMERFPDIELIMKPVATMRDVAAGNLDIAVLLGWPPKRDIV